MDEQEKSGPLSRAAVHFARRLAGAFAAEPGWKLRKRYVDAQFGSSFGVDAGRVTRGESAPAGRMSSMTSKAPGAPDAQGPQDPSLFTLIGEDYGRHGSSVTDPAFVSLLIHRYGRWAWQRRNPAARWLGTKLYGLLKVLILNVTKVWIPPQATIGKDFHIIHAEGSLSIHPDAVIGDRCGVMHNVTIGTNMGPGAPVIGDDVFIGVNSTVLGPIRVGDRVRIGANTCVTTNVPSDSIVIGSPGKIYKRLTPFGPSGRQGPKGQASAQAKET